MHFFRGQQSLQRFDAGCIATIGNFDGVHKGHRHILQHLRKLAEQMQLPATVIVFEPHPLEFFRPEAAPVRLMTLRDKAETLAELGIDNLVCLRFNQALAQMQANDFIETILHQQMGVKHLIVGDDFKFGYQRQGDFALLKHRGSELGFSVEDTKTVALDGERVSSSRVRQALAAGDMRQAAYMLERPYAVIGRVQHGEKIGRQIGFPTANLSWQRPKPPLCGVYAVKVLIDGQYYQAVANCGRKPTIGERHELIEVHVFDWHGDLYGKRIRVEFVDFIRNEQKFDSLDALKQQIERDCEQAKQRLSL